MGGVFKSGREKDRERGEYVCVQRCTHAIAKTRDEAECSSHANEGLGKYSDG